MTPFKFRQNLITILGDLIGTYTYPDGTELPAISIGEIPDDVTVRGVEICLPKFPDVSDSMRTSNLMHRTEDWLIMFYLHDLDDQGYENMYDAVNMMYNVYPMIYGTDMKMDKRFNSLPGYKFTVTIASKQKTANPFNLDMQRANYGGTTTCD